MWDERGSFELAFRSILREKRLAKGWSQQDLAMMAGYDLTFISKLERGRRMPSLHTFVTLSMALDITPSALMREMEEGPKPDLTKNKRVRAVKARARRITKTGSNEAKPAK